jgi:hypothetical protein
LIFLASAGVIWLLARFALWPAPWLIRGIMVELGTWNLNDWHRCQRYIIMNTQGSSLKEPAERIFQSRRNTPTCQLPLQLTTKKNVRSLNHANSLLAVSYSNSEPHTYCDEIDDSPNHLVPRHLLGVSLGPSPSYSTSSNLGLGRSIRRGDSSLCVGCMFSRLSTNLVPYHSVERRHA